MGRETRMNFHGRLALAGMVLLTLGLGAQGARAEDWLPVTPEELQMTAEPKAPRAPAIYLYHRVDRDDRNADEFVYVRLKVLTDEGRKYGDIEIQFDHARETIGAIAARTIAPDGRIAKFDGTVYEKTIIKSQDVKYLAKVFTLPNVIVGTIIEYRYRRHMDLHYVFDSHWVLTDELFTKHGKYTLTPNQYFALAWSWPNGLPAGSPVPDRKGNEISLETFDVPAFVSEEFMPPELTLKQRVDFVYSDGRFPKDAKDFWTHVGKDWFRDVEHFVDERRAMERALPQIVETTDSQEQKLRKIYARIQSMRNLSFDAPATEEERKHEDLRKNDNVADVWSHGYGYAEELDRLFIALARAAGLAAGEARIAPRDRVFFRPQLMNTAQLTTTLAHVVVGTQDLYLDPGMLFAPFGVLPWGESGTSGLELGKDGGRFINTPPSIADASRIDRKATMTLADDGSLIGHVVVTYTGLEALGRRISERREDTATRKRDMEDALKAVVPVGCSVTLVGTPDWTTSAPELVVEYDLKVPAWAGAAGTRRLMPLGLFTAGSRQTFAVTSRVHPMYFQYAYIHNDDVTIRLPGGLKIDAVVEPKNIDRGGLTYSIGLERSGDELRLKRSLSLKGPYIPVKFYDSVHDFFQNVRASDEQQIVLARTAKTASP
jgi:hypothetical protein